MDGIYYGNYFYFGSTVLDFDHTFAIHTYGVVYSVLSAPANAIAIIQITCAPVPASGLSETENSTAKIGIGIATATYNQDYDFDYKFGTYVRESTGFLPLFYPASVSDPRLLQVSASRTISLGYIISSSAINVNVKIKILGWIVQRNTFSP